MKFVVKAEVLGMKVPKLSITIRHEGGLVASTDREPTVAAAADFFNEFAQRWGLSDEETVALLTQALAQIPASLPAR